MDNINLAVAGFRYMNWGNMVRCSFCGVELGHRQEGDNPFKDHQRWSPPLGFIKGFFVGNLTIGSGDLHKTTPQSLPADTTFVGFNAVFVLACNAFFVMCASFLTLHKF